MSTAKNLLFVLTTHNIFDSGIAFKYYLLKPLKLGTYIIAHEHVLLCIFSRVYSKKHLLVEMFPAIYFSVS